MSLFFLVSYSLKMPFSIKETSQITLVKVTSVILENSQGFFEVLKESC